MTQPELPLLSVIDMHTHIWQDSSVSGSCAEDERVLLEMADRYGIEALVVMPLFGGLCPTRDDITAGNQAVASFARRDSRVKPMAHVYPRHGSFAAEEAARWMDAGFAGVKIWVNLADDPCVFPVVEQTIRYGRPVLIHAMHKSIGQLPLESDPTHIAALAARYPEARIIMAHIGGNFIYSSEIIAPYDNIWTDPSGSYCETGMLEHAVRVLGPDRIMFGTDAPGASFINNLAKVVTADLPTEVIAKILAGNARKLWGWA